MFKAVLIAIVSGLSLYYSCLDHLGYSRVVLVARSPDRSATASVRSHPCIDPPCQSLWLGAGFDPPTRLVTLGQDQAWCKTIVWSPDSSRVGFLVQDAQIRVFDVASGREVARRDLVERDAYPTTKVATNLEFSDDGADLNFVVCSRRNLGHCTGQPTSIRLEMEPFPE